MADPCIQLGDAQLQRLLGAFAKASEPSPFDKGLRRLLEVAVVGLIAAVIWNGQHIRTLDVRVKHIEGNRFTSADWMAHQRPITEGLSVLTAGQAAIMAKLEALAMRQLENSDDIDALEEAVMRDRK
jgi:hypothetical protein